MIIFTILLGATLAIIIGFGYLIYYITSIPSRDFNFITRIFLSYFTGLKSMAIHTNELRNEIEKLKNSKNKKLMLQKLDEIENEMAEFAKNLSETGIDIMKNL